MSGKQFKSKKFAPRICGLLLLAILLAIPFSCSEIMQRTIVRTYEARLALNTKTALSSEGNVSWIAGDQITYYSQDDGPLRAYTVGEDAVSATMPLILAADDTYLTAVYGTSSITNYKRDALTLENAIKAVQPGTFVDGHVAVARTTQVEEPSLLFYNIVSFITFSTSLTDVDHVVFASNDETALHANGTVTIQYVDGVPTANLGTNRGNSIRVDLNGAGLYYIATLPGMLQNGFTLSCYDADDKLIGTATGSNALSIQRASIARLGLIDDHLVDINGIKLIGYGPDSNWDGTLTSGAGFINSTYGNDYNWDTNMNSGANINKGGYNGDSNWDSNGNGNGNVGKDGYGGDSNWDTNNNSGGNLGINGYGNDLNWN